jgi:hypothetical protein
MIFMTLIFLILSQVTFAANLDPTTFPIFLRMGFSSIIDFSETPQRVVIGDSQGFQIEKLEKSLVLRTLVPYATTNMFVYFKDAPPQIFSLTADEDANPTVYRKFEVLKPVKTSSVAPVKATSKLKRGAFLGLASWDKAKDYLTIDGHINANQGSAISPKWEMIRLVDGDKRISPYKVWSERQEVQKDSTVKFRFIFLRPNINKDLKKNFIIIPIQGKTETLHLELKKGR